MHTLNGTACAISRTLVYLFEHYQDPDGGFRIPEVLQPYMGGRSYIDPGLSRTGVMECLPTAPPVLDRNAVTCRGGMPERPNGTVLKTVG